LTEVTTTAPSCQMMTAPIPHCELIKERSVSEIVMATFQLRDVDHFFLVTTHHGF
jgi:hypothetical protein